MFDCFFVGTILKNIRDILTFLIAQGQTQRHIS